MLLILRDRVANLQSLLRRELVWVVLICAVLALTLSSPNFFTAGNLLNVLRQVTIVGIVAVGVAIVVVGGNFDLSVGAILTLAAVVSVQIQPTNAARTVLSMAIPLCSGRPVGVLSTAASSAGCAPIRSSSRSARSSS